MVQTWVKSGYLEILTLSSLTHLLGFRAQRFTLKGSRLRVAKHFVYKRGVPAGGVTACVIDIALNVASPLV